MTPNELVNIFVDTVTITRQDPAIAAKTADTIRNTTVYGPHFRAPVHKDKRADVELRVVEGSTLDTARSMGIGKTAVLNFANPHTPGGGVRRGARAQEECLCRCSNLFDALNTPALQNDYYKWHAENTNHLFSDKVIYTPNIQVVKDDRYALLKAPFSVDVMTCAAPYNGRPFGEDILGPVYVSRITNILEAAIDRDVDTVVLGAFGCGAFYNPPELMAAAFRKVLIDHGYARGFRQVIFAILNTHPFQPNYTVFRKELTE